MFSIQRIKSTKGDNKIVPKCINMFEYRSQQLNTDTVWNKTIPNQSPCNLNHRVLIAISNSTTSESKDDWQLDSKVLSSMTHYLNKCFSVEKTNIVMESVDGILTIYTHQGKANIFFHCSCATRRTHHLQKISIVHDLDKRALSLIQFSQLPENRFVSNLKFVSLQFSSESTLTPPQSKLSLRTYILQSPKLLKILQINANILHDQLRYSSSNSLLDITAAFSCCHHSKFITIYLMEKKLSENAIQLVTLFIANYTSKVQQASINIIYTYTGAETNKLAFPILCTECKTYNNPVASELQSIYDNFPDIASQILVYMLQHMYCIHHCLKTNNTFLTFVTIDQPTFDGAIQLRKFPSTPTCPYSNRPENTYLYSAEEGKEHGQQSKQKGKTMFLDAAKAQKITQEFNTQLSEFNSGKLNPQYKIISPCPPETKVNKQSSKISDQELKRQWTIATRKDLKAFIELTFDLNRQPHPGEQVLPSIFTFKSKMTSNRDLNKIQTKLCASKGFQDIQGQYVFPTSPIRLSKTLSVLGEEYTKGIKQPDIISALSQRKIPCRIFLYTKAKIAQQCLVLSIFTTKHLQLEKTTYRVVPIRRYWFKNLNNILQQIGRGKSIVNTCHYTQNTKAGTMKVNNHVDNPPHLSPTDKAAEDFVKELENRFAYNLIDSTHSQLGTKIKFNDKCATSDQQPYQKYVVNKLNEKKTDIIQRDALSQIDLIFIKKDLLISPGLHKDRYLNTQYKAAMEFLIGLSLGKRNTIVFAIDHMAKLLHILANLCYKFTIWLSRHKIKHPIKSCRSIIHLSHHT